jgi:tetratricopeptide (TPR) repeat protein
LYATVDKLEAATQALETAVSLDNNYANARYFLAIAYLDSGRNDDALIQLNIVLENNADNEDLKSLIEQVNTGVYKKDSRPVVDVSVNGADTVSQNEDITTTTKVPKTNLVSPLNRSIDKQNNSTPAGEFATEGGGM